MDNLKLLGVLAVTVVLMTGCGKKHEAETEMDANAVVSENVVSVTDASMPADPNAIPVVVENATATQAVTELAATGVVSDKPTPKNIQQALKNAGVYIGKVDGNVGPKTKKAIAAFQAQNGLKADGKVGPKTWKALSAYLNKPTEVVNPSAIEGVPAGQ